MDNQQPKVFQAIDGAELKALILADLAKRLDQEPQFKRHLTYPIVSFAYSIVISAYPMDPSEFTIRGKEQYKRAEVPDDATPDVVTVKGIVSIDAPAEGGLAPDQAREQYGLPVTSPTRVGVGKVGANISDVASQPAEPVLPRRDTTAEEVSPQASVDQMRRIQNSRNQGKTPKNRVGASPSFGRSVDLKTRPTVGQDEGVARIDENIMGPKGD